MPSRNKYTKISESILSHVFSGLKAKALSTSRSRPCRRRRWTIFLNNSTLRKRTTRSSAKLNFSKICSTFVHLILFSVNTRNGKMAKKCHVLFEWPLNAIDDFFSVKHFMWVSMSTGCTRCPAWWMSRPWPSRRLRTVLCFSKARKTFRFRLRSTL